MHRVHGLARNGPHGCGPPVPPGTARRGRAQDVRVEWGAAQGLHGSRRRELPPGQGRVTGAARSSSLQDGGTGRTSCRKTFVEPADFIRTGEDFWAAGLLAPCGSDVRLSMKTGLSAGTGERLGMVAACCGRRGPSSGEGSLSCGGPWGSGGCALQPE